MLTFTSRGLTARVYKALENHINAYDSVLCQEKLLLIVLNTRFKNVALTVRYATSIIQQRVGPQLIK